MGKKKFISYEEASKIAIENNITRAPEELVIKNK
jgi:hypothetical protein